MNNKVEEKNGQDDKVILLKTKWMSIAIICLAIISPIILTLPIGIVSFNKTGQIGDTIGGIMSPFIGIAAAFLTYMAFYVQYKANLRQWDEIKKQNIRDEEDNLYDRIDKFDYQFYRMLDYHKEIVRNMSFKADGNQYEGANCFSEILQTFNSDWKRLHISENTYLPVQDNDIFHELLPTKKENAILKYLSIYYGKLLLNERCFNKYQQCFTSSELYNALLYNKLSIGASFFNNNPSYSKYGYSTILGHYFRHLFQIVKYIDSFYYELLQKINDMTEFEFKYSYIKILRSNLTNSEQILLFYNCLTPFGYEWKDSTGISFFKKYKIVKNIPLPMIKGYDPVDWYKNELGVTDEEELRTCFEWYDT